MARILVVEDEIVIALNIEACLKNSGHIVSLACNGEKAMEMVRLAQPEIIFMDWGLPGLKGCEVTKRLKDEGYAGVIICMSSGSHDVKETMLKAGCSFAVDKASIQTNNPGFTIGRDLIFSFLAVSSQGSIDSSTIGVAA